MKRFLVLMFMAALFFQCETDKSVTPTENVDTLMTENIKETPYFYSFAKQDVVETFDLIFVNNGRTIAVYSNGGPNGSAGVMGKNLGAVDFDANAGLDELLTDSEENYIIGEAWYNYDFTTHTLSSKGDVYLFRAVDYNYYKLRIDSYESGGIFNITFSKLDEQGKPVNTQTVSVTAADGVPAHFQFAAGTVMQTVEPWDVAFVTIPLYIEEMNAYIQNPGVRINSADGAQVAVISDTEYADITEATEHDGFLSDAGDVLAVGDALLNYNPQTHVLTPPEVSYLLNATDGSFAKFKVTSYYHPQTGDSGFISFMAESL